MPGSNFIGLLLIWAVVNFQWKQSPSCILAFLSLIDPVTLILLVGYPGNMPWGCYEGWDVTLGLGPTGDVHVRELA